MSIFRRYPDRWVSHYVIYVDKNGDRRGSPEWENKYFALDFYNNCKKDPNIISALLREEKIKARTTYSYVSDESNKNYGDKNEKIYHGAWIG